MESGYHHLHGATQLQVLEVDLLISVLKFAIHSRSDGFMVLLSGLQSCQPDPAPPAPAAEGDDSDLNINSGAILKHAIQKEKCCMWFQDITII